MKKIFIGLAIAFLCVMKAQAEELSSPEDIIKIINYCYEDENKIGTQLSECALEKLKKYNNPSEYHIYFSDENPSKSIERPTLLVIYNKYGHVLICKASAKEKIVYRECNMKTIPNFTKEKLMKIIPEL